MICLTRSGVSPITEITMSTLSVSRKGMRLAPVTCCISSLTPSALATMPASSTSKPSGSRWAFCEPNGGTSSGVAMRTVPFLRMSSKASALAAWPPQTANVRANRPASIRLMSNFPPIFPQTGIDFELPWGQEEAMTARREIFKPLPGAAFGATVRLGRSLAEELPDDLPALLAEAGGLLLLSGLSEITSKRELLVRLSYLFGPEVEDYRTLL